MKVFFVLTTLSSPFILNLLLLTVRLQPTSSFCIFEKVQSNNGHTCASSSSRTRLGLMRTPSLSPYRYEDSFLRKTLLKQSKQSNNDSNDKDTNNQNDKTNKKIQITRTPPPRPRTTIEEKLDNLLDTQFFDPDQVIDNSDEENTKNNPILVWFATLVKNDYQTAEAFYAAGFISVLVIFTQELLRMVKYGDAYIPFTNIGSVGGGGGGSLF